MQQLDKFGLLRPVVCIIGPGQSVQRLGCSEQQMKVLVADCACAPHDPIETALLRCINCAPSRDPPR
eukprot:9353119-Alexandrium_andersonii.AAC.1